jgi:hypothetical protein
MRVLYSARPRPVAFTRASLSVHFSKNRLFRSKPSAWPALITRSRMGLWSVLFHASLTSSSSNGALGTALKVHYHAWSLKHVMAIWLASVLCVRSVGEECGCLAPRSSSRSSTENMRFATLSHVNFNFLSSLSQSIPTRAPAATASPMSPRVFVRLKS